MPPTQWANGWSWDYGVVTGTVGERPLWGGEDVFNDAAVLLYRLAVPGPPGWVVHRDDEVRFRERARQSGVPWPAGEATDLGGGWLGYGALAARPVQLQRREAMFQDAAGLHWWRFDTVTNTSVRGMRHHSGRVATLLGSCADRAPA